jgi:hypothetical protein
MSENTPNSQPVEFGLSGDKELEARIKVAELGLGIVTPAQRFQEAALLIDRPYLEVSAVVDPDNKHPERAFGHKEWLGHLMARQFTRDDNDTSLSFALLVGIHRSYVRPVDSSQAGVFMEGKNWYRSGSQDADPVLGYIDLTPVEEKVIRANPHVTFQVSKNSRDGQGWITYARMDSVERRKAVEGVCNWYNEARLVYNDPVLLAAELQRRIVSLHPFALGVNGRPSRAAQNWSLENAQLPPSAPADFDKDVVLDVHAWRNEVAAGQRWYAHLGRLSVARQTDPSVIFDVQPQQDYYQEVLRHSVAPPDRLTPGAQHDRNAYMRFAKQLRQGKLAAV